MKKQQTLFAQIEQLNQLGIALSKESNKDRVMEQIVQGAMELTHADGCSLYVVKDNAIHFHIVRNDSLKLAMGGTSGNPITLDPIPLLIKGKPNRHNLISASLIDKKTIHVSDAYKTKQFNLAGTYAFDKAQHYHSKSFLTVPLINHENEVIGGFQLINATDPATGLVIDFTIADKHLAQSLASQAAVILTQKQLLQEQKQVFEAMMALIAKAIDEKSKYTSEHCRRVPELSFMLADAALKATSGPFKNFKLTDDEQYELRIAAWMHDCGKLSTPEYVMDKSTKLECIFDRIALMAQRYEIMQRDVELKYLRKEISDTQRIFELKKLADAYQLIVKSNQGGESISPEDVAGLKKIAKTFFWKNTAGEMQPWINDEELMNLLVARGTLNETERKAISNHVSVTLKMLRVLPLPKYLKNLPDIAGSHHEKVDGSGYPRGLTGDKMTTQAKIIAIADIFEALTAADRPYKQAKSLSEALSIMKAMKQQGHIDPDLFDLFIKSKVYLKYAKKFLAKDKIDKVDEEKLLS